jgi:uncharacterized DUF497 family protein
MHYEWDEQKRLSKLEKHGLDFFDVDTVFEAPHIEVPAFRKDSLPSAPLRDVS